MLPSFAEMGHPKRKVEKSECKNENGSNPNPEFSFFTLMGGYLFCQCFPQKTRRNTEFLRVFSFLFDFSGRPGLSAVFKMGPERSLSFLHIEGIPPKCRDFKTGSFSLQARQRTRHGRTVFMEAKGRAQGSTSRHLFFFVSESLCI